MPFLTLNGVTYLVRDDTDRRRIMRRGDMKRSARGQLRDGRRGHRREYRMSTCFTEHDDAETLIRTLNGEGHVAYMRDGFQASTQLHPDVLDADGLRWDTSATPFAGFAAGALVGASVAVDRLVYDIQACDGWGIFWAEEFSATQHFAAARDDGIHYTDGVRTDADFGGPFGWRVDVTDGRVKWSTSTSAPGTLAHVVMLPFRPSTGALAAWTSAPAKPWGPTPQLRVEGDVIETDHEFVFGEVTGVEYVEQPSAIDGFGWVSNSEVVSFALYEVANAFVSDDRVESQGSVS